MMFTDFASRARVSRVIAAAALALIAFGADVRAASFDTLHTFPDNPKNGRTPLGSMVRDANGAIYGVTVQGGPGNCMAGCGTIYQLTPRKTGEWRFKVLHKFVRETDGAAPEDGLIMGPDGSLYGTAAFGGSLDGGTVYRLAPPAAGQTDWTFEVLHEFDDASTNDKSPIGRLMLGKDGALYGVNTTTNSGTIYRIKRTKTGWAYRALYHFTERLNSQWGLVEDAKGRLYGVGYLGGANNRGVLFRLSPPAQAGGDWAYKILHDFSDDAGDAKNPDSTLVLRDDALYGQASSNVSGEGSVVFRFTLPSTFEVIYRMDETTQGTGPGTGLTIDAQGVIYGVNQSGGAGSEGTLFKLLPPTSGAYRFRLLHAFSGGDGRAPYCQPLLDEQGNVYVNTQFGGAADNGGIFVYRP